MTCPYCQTDNRAAANFCKRCGMILSANCPRCGGDLPADADYCDACGLPLNPRTANQWNPGKATRRTSAQPQQVEQVQRPQVRELPVAVKEQAPQPILQANSESFAPINNLERFASRELLEKLETARSKGSMVGERRVVTMLFCDVKGSTAAAEKLDPEEWGEIMNGAFELMIRPVYAYEGIVARMFGDSILAFFGAPITHEDDPARAVLAGLEIISDVESYRLEIEGRFGIEFNVRVGINTGMVVVGVVGSDLRMEYTALGDAINLAARMEQAAAPGTLLIGHDTYKLIKNQFDFEPLGGIDVKGKSEPVLVYRVLGRKAHSVRQRGIEGLHAEMVGRANELQALSTVLGDLHQGIGWNVCVLGEAGIGKSRLIKEARSNQSSRNDSVIDWFEAGSLSYETNQAYGLLLRLIQQILEIDYDDPPDQVRSKIALLVETLAVEQRSTARHVFEALFSLNSNNGMLEGDSFKLELLASMKAWWRGQFSLRPTVIVFDDMHWSDAASIDLLKLLLPLTEEVPLVLVFSMREERDSAAWMLKTWVQADYRHRSTEIALRPLTDDETNEMVNRLLAVAELPDKLRAGILEKSGGNPFFVEEVVRSLIENGVVVPEDRTIDGITRRFWKSSDLEVDFEIPDNLQTLLSTRIDRLEEGTRSTLQIAAIIGRSFYRRVLQAVDEAERDLDKRLGTLIRVDMIREAARLPELEYAFRNPLTQEAVYNTILLKKRREFHRKVGEVIESLYTERVDLMYGLLAHHFALAGEKSKAAGYYRQLASQAVSVYAYEDALKNIRQAVELIQSDIPNETHLATWEEMGDICRLLRDGPGAIKAYEHALDAFNHLVATDGFVDEPFCLLRLNRKIILVVSEMKWSVSLEEYYQANEYRLIARASLETGLSALQGNEVHTEIARTLMALSIDAWRIQEPPDWEEAEAFAQQAVNIAQQINDPLLRSQALGALATVWDGSSRLREHLEAAEQRLNIVLEDKFEDRRERIEARRSYGAALMYVGEYEQAIPYLQKAAHFAVQARIFDEQVNCLGLQAQCCLRLDRWDEVLEIEEQWRDLERRYSRVRIGET